MQPLWRADNRELFYIDPRGTLVAVAIEEQGGDLVAGEPRQLFRVVTSLGMSASRVVAPSADGERFLVIRPVHAEAPVLHLVTNWKMTSLAE